MSYVFYYKMKSEFFFYFINKKFVDARRKRIINGDEKLLFWIKI